MYVVEEHIKHVAKIIVYYFVATILLNFAAATIYMWTVETALGWKIVWLYTISGQVLQICPVTKIVLIVESVRIALSGIFLALCTSYIFSAILCKPPKIVFPDKLVIRYRTTGSKEGNLALGALIGSKRANTLHNVNCRLSCAYVVKKSETGELLKNSEFNMIETIGSIKNYYRFSFHLDELPVGLLSNYLTKSEESMQKDVVTITLFGKTTDLNREFYISKDYQLSDIIISNQTSPEKNFVKKNYFTKSTRVNWRKFVEVHEDGEEMRRCVINDIEKIIVRKSVQQKDETHNIKKTKVAKKVGRKIEAEQQHISYLEMKLRHLNDENEYLENIFRKNMSE